MVHVIPLPQPGKDPWLLLLIVGVHQDGGGASDHLLAL